MFIFAMQITSILTYSTSAQKDLRRKLQELLSNFNSFQLQILLKWWMYLKNSCTLALCLHRTIKTDTNQGDENGLQVTVRILAAPSESLEAPDLGTQTGAWQSCKRSQPWSTPSTQLPSLETEWPAGGLRAAGSSSAPWTWPPSKWGTGWGSHTEHAF